MITKLSHVADGGMFILNRSGDSFRRINEDSRGANERQGRVNCVRLEQGVNIEEVYLSTQCHVTLIT